MVHNLFSRWMILPSLLLLAGIACSTSVVVSTPPDAEPTATREIQTQPATQLTETTQPVVIDTATVQVTKAALTPEPTCTVLSETLNLRAGPSQLYRPPIRALTANSVVVPLGYLPKGLIQGRWAYVRDQASQDEGWVSAESNFLSCTIDLASLPSVDFDPPPPYTPISDTSPGPGTCGDTQTSDNDGAEYDCNVVYSNGFPVQFIIYKNGQEAGKADGIQNVAFTVEDKNGRTIYSKTENDAAYCVFGGNAPCPSWTLENYLYRWGAGGPLLESGTYTLKINPTLDDTSVNLFWSADINVTLPFLKKGCTMARTYIQDLMSENERILLETHQHWFVLFNKIFLEIILIVIIFAASLFAAAYYPLAIAGLALVLVPLTGMLKDIMVWRNQAYMVTNRRVIQISGVLGKDVVDSSLEKVNDVKMSQSFFGRMFGYGDVEILTASELGVNLFHQIANPVEFKTAMLNAKERLGFEEMGMAADAIEDIPTMIEKLDVLRSRGVLSEAEFQQKKAELLAKM